MTGISDPYPGAGANAGDMLRYAGAYHAAALALLTAGRDGDPLARAPARFCAVHAIELYLDAFLRSLGESPCRLRAHHHNLVMRAALAIQHGLSLRRKTALHLVRLTADREYLVLRYGPERCAAVCELNRLTASLEEIARKVRQAAEPASCDGRDAA
jgi:hypothetical protein